MRIILLTIIVFIAVSGSQAQSGFKQTQQTYQRVRNATREKGDTLLAMLYILDLEPENIELYIQVFKMEKIFFMSIIGIQRLLFFRMVDTPYSNK